MERGKRWSLGETNPYLSLSHAACYAVVAYQTAWLKYHYPLQYMCSVFKSADFKDIPKLCGDLRYMGIKLYGPDINISESDFSIHGDSIYYGVSKIKGLGKSAEYIVEERNANGPFRTISKFIERTLPSASMLEDLTKAGAFDSICDNRQAILMLSDTCKKCVKDVKDAVKKVESASDNEKRNKAFHKLNEKISEIRKIVPDMTVCEDEFQNLKKEKELLGEYLSGHPVSFYPKAESFKGVQIEEVYSMPHGTKVKIIGIVSEFTEKFRKRDGKKMAFFDFTDTSSSVPVCCFTESYEKYGNLLNEDAIVVIEGSLMVSTSEENDAEIRKISVEKIFEINPEKEIIVIYDTDPDNWMRNTLDRILPYSSKNGNPVNVYFAMFDEIRETDLSLNPLIVKEQPVKCCWQNK